MRKFSAVLILSVIVFAGLSVPAAAAVPTCSAPTLTPSSGALVGDEVTSSVSCTNSPTSYAYQWLQSTSASGTYSEITGANSSNFTIPASLGGYFIKLRVTASNEDGPGSPVLSNASSRVYFPSQLFAGAASDTSYFDAQGTLARLGRIADMTTDGRDVYFSDYQNKVIRKISPSGEVTTVAGDGQARYLDGVGRSASFLEPRHTTYDVNQNSLIIEDAGKFRILNLATMAVTTMRNRAFPISYQQSGTAVTLTFASDSGIEQTSSVVLTGVDPLLDGTITTTGRTNTTITFTAGFSRTLTSTALVGATAETDMGPSGTSNNWGGFKSGSEVAPDGRYYHGRGNFGSSSNQMYLLRFTKIEAGVYSYEKLFTLSNAACDISFENNTTLYANTCGRTLKLTTTDDWQTYSVITLENTYNDSSQLLPDGLVYVANRRIDPTTTPYIPLQYWAGSINDTLKAPIGDDLFVAASFGSVVYKISRLGYGDSTPPTLVTTSPANGASNLPIASSITLEFSENVSAGAGKSLVLVNRSDATQNITIGASSGSVAISGSTVTITPASNLQPGVTYHLLADLGAFADSTGNLFAGITSTTLLVFQTAATIVAGSGDSTSYAGPLCSSSKRTAAPGTKVAFDCLRALGVTSATVAGWPAEIRVLSDSRIEIVVPSRATSGEWDLLLTGSFGKLTVQDAILVVSSSNPSADVTPRTWTKNQLDGTVKLYAIDAVGAGKIQFMLNDREVAWANAVSISDDKIRMRADTPYFVRTVVLNVGEKNVLEIYVDGVRTWRAAYSN